MKQEKTLDDHFCLQMLNVGYVFDCATHRTITERVDDAVGEAVPQQCPAHHRHGEVDGGQD